MLTRKYLNALIIYFVTLCCLSIKSFSQADIKDAYFDSCAQRWHLTTSYAKMSAINVQVTPYNNDNILVSFYMNGYYQIPSTVLDSLLSKNQYVTSDNPEVKKIIKRYKIIIPSVR